MDMNYLVEINTKVLLNSIYSNDDINDGEFVEERNIFDKIEIGKYIIIDVFGDSMRNAGIFNRDILLFDTNIDIIKAKNKICLVRLNEKDFIKRIKLFRTSYILQSENPDYPPYLLKQTDKLEIIGVLKGKFESNFH